MPKKNELIELGGNSYRLYQNIGNGGSASVWLAQSGEEKYAIKFITSGSQNKIARFENEIKFCEKTEHKNIVKVLANGLHQGDPCYVMPYYSRTFRSVVSTETDVSLLIGYILEICKGLKYIHSKGVYHRDIKPENILIDQKKAVLADFGIAHFKEVKITRRDELLANRNYMAPEQKIKNNTKNIDSAVDVYALGIMINECFTKQNLGGSSYALIANSHPMFSELDSLVANMIRQSPSDRPDIGAVETEIKFVYGKIKRDFSDLKSQIKLSEYPKSLKQKTLTKILEQATEDILTGGQLLYGASYQEFRKYNRNWHMNIGYQADDFLMNLYMQEEILRRCKGKFMYESNVYSKSNWHSTLDLAENGSDMALYQRLVSILERYKFRKLSEQRLDMSGKILKYFAGCADYHCAEILDGIVELEKDAKRNLMNAPILWIVGTLKAGIEENKDLISGSMRGDGGIYDFYFEEHISINWGRTIHFKTNDDDQDYFDQQYLEEVKIEQDILSAFGKKWGIRYNILDKDRCSIKFTSTAQYEKFKNYALNLAKPYYIFEGDVLELFAYPNFTGDIVEILVSRIFAIPYTLAKLVGLKEVE